MSALALLRRACLAPLRATTTTAQSSIPRAYLSTSCTSSISRTMIISQTTQRPTMMVVSNTGALFEQIRGMKVRSSVKKLCEGCKVCGLFLHLVLQYSKWFVSMSSWWSGVGTYREGQGRCAGLHIYYEHGTNSSIVRTKERRKEGKGTCLYYMFVESKAQAETRRMIWTRECILCRELFRFMKALQGVRNVIDYSYIYTLHRFDLHDYSLSLFWRVNIFVEWTAFAQNRTGLHPTFRQYSAQWSATASFPSRLDIVSESTSKSANVFW